MAEISIKEACENFKAIIDRVAAGERVSILRRSKVVAELVPPTPTAIPRAPSLATFRKSIRVKGKALSLEVIEARKERG